MGESGVNGTGGRGGGPFDTFGWVGVGAGRLPVGTAGTLDFVERWREPIREFLESFSLNRTILLPADRRVTGLPVGSAYRQQRAPVTRQP